MPMAPTKSMYILKRYHSLAEVECEAWHLAREVAVAASSDDEAIRTTKGCLMGQLGSLGGVLILFAPDGTRIWEEEFPALNPTA